ncbi:autotransporter outer membrane beta-barrel domain-containing protein [Helicobacter winghamensis]
MGKVLDNYSNIPAGGGAFKRHLLAPFTGKAFRYSVLATSLSTFIFHSQAYAQSNDEKSVPQIIANQLQSKDLIIDNNTQNENLNFTGDRTFDSLKLKGSGLYNINFDNKLTIGDFDSKEIGEKAQNNYIQEIKEQMAREKFGFDWKQQGITQEQINKEWEKLSDKQILDYAIKHLENNLGYIGQAVLKINGKEGSVLNIEKIDNKSIVDIKADKLEIANGIKSSGFGALKIEFKEGEIKGKIETSNAGLAALDLYRLGYSNNIEIKTQNGTISGPIELKEYGYIELILDGGGSITGNVVMEKPTNSPIFMVRDDLVGLSYMGESGIEGAQVTVISKNGTITGDVELKESLKESDNTFNYLLLLFGEKALMTGNINVKGGEALLNLRANGQLQGDVNVEKDGNTTIYGGGTYTPIFVYDELYDGIGLDYGTNNLVSGKITNRGYLDVSGQTEQGLTIQQTIDNIGGTLAVRNVNWDGDKNINGIKFLRGGKDGNVGTDAHFKNINGGKIAINGWDFREKEGNGRIVIDTGNGGNDGTREQNLNKVAFGTGFDVNGNIIRSTQWVDGKEIPITITLFGDDKIFAKGSYVQYLVLTPEEEKRICNNGNCGDVNKGTGIYDKDGRHNVAGHFIEGGAGANGESNFATLLSEGKVIKLSVGGGDSVAPVVQSDGLIGELKVNDNIPGSTIGSNQINALNTNMTQTFNTLKEISTKTFRTEHTNLLSSNTLKEQVAYALYNHSKNVSKNNSLDNNPINKNLSSNNLKNHTNNNLLSYNAKNNSLNDNINLLDDTGDLSNTNIASNVSNINALTNPASNTSENNTSSNVSNNTNLEAYATDEQITTYATYAQAGASDALLYDEINKGYTDLDLLRALDDIFIKQNKKESDLYTYAVPYYNYIKDKSLGLGTTKTNSYGLLAGGQLNSNYGVYGFYINLENSKRENNTTSTDTDSTSYLAGLTYYNAFHRFSNKELYVSLNTMLGTTKSDVSMIDSDFYKDDFDFDSLNYGAELRAGVNIYNVLTNSYWTPELGLIYTGMAVDSYEIKHTKLTEYYDKTTINLLEGVAGLRFHHAYDQTTRFNAALGAKFRLYDDAKSQMKIAGETLANPLFATRDIKLPDTSYYVQFGLVKLLGDNVELSLNYQGNFAKDIQGHTAFARIGYWW